MAITRDDSECSEGFSIFPLCHHVSWETFGSQHSNPSVKGIPVVGFKNEDWSPFVSMSLQFLFLLMIKISALSSKLIEVVEKYSPENLDTESSWSSISHESRQIADRYTEERWMEQVRSILPKDTKKILLRKRLCDASWGN